MFVCGCNNNCQLGEESNKKKTNKFPIICPPGKSHLILSKLLSISACSSHMVFVNQKFQAFGIGHNAYCRITPNINLELLEEEKEIIIKDEYDLPFKFISAVCGNNYTLYLVKSEKNMEKFQLIFASDYNPHIYVNIHSKTPISLFGGGKSAAVIDTEGNIIVLNDTMLKNKDLVVEPHKLPSNDIPVDVAFYDDYILVVDSNGNLFQSRIEFGKKLSIFYKIHNLSCTQIVSITGKHHHCFAVSNDGRIFGIGSNANCKLGFPSNIKRLEKFTEIESLNGYKIASAFAGFEHSIFKTSTGKILGCGDNSYGQLFTDKTGNIVFPPTEFHSCYNDHFFIAGDNFSIAINEKIVPPNTPNRRIEIWDRPKPIIKSISIPSSSPCESSHLIKKIQEIEQEMAKLHNEFKSKEENYKLHIKELEKKLKKGKQETEKIELPKNQIEILDEKKLKQFNQIKRIGRGSTSEVFEVSREKHYAQKFLFFEDENDIENMKKLLNEYHILSRLNSPYIIKTFGMSFGTETEQPSIILELCSSNLKQRLKYLNDDERCRVICEVSKGMRDVHSAGLIHRDLKLENILLEEENHVKLSDFGFCILIKSDTMTSRSITGTLKYMAPELILEKTDYDEKVDVYAFGVVVYVIAMNGEFPKISIIDVGNGNKAEIPSTMTTFTRELINNCWAFNASDRPSFDEICKMLEGNENKLI